MVLWGKSDELECVLLTEPKITFRPRGNDLFNQHAFSTMLHSVSWKEAGGHFPFQCKSQHPPSHLQDCRGGCHTHPPGCLGGTHRTPHPAELERQLAWSASSNQRRNTPPHRDEVEGDSTFLLMGSVLPVQRGNLPHRHPAVEALARGEGIPPAKLDKL